MIPEITIIEPDMEVYIAHKNELQFRDSDGRLVFIRGLSPERWRKIARSLWYWNDGDGATENG